MVKKLGRNGASRMGCLFSLLILSLIVYYGVTVGGNFVDYYRFRDAMQQQARFAVNRDNGTITRQLRTTATEIDLPEEARRNLRVRRTARPRQVIITSEWTIVLELPFYTYPWVFTPEVTAPI